MSADNSPKVLLLDVMSTLVYDPFHEVMPAFFGMTMAEMMAAKHPSAWIEFEHGRMDAGTFLDQFFADGREFDRAGFMRAIRDAYTLLPGIGPLLAELAHIGVPMYALSNYPVWYRLIEAELGLSRFLDWSFVSCDTGVRKPASQAYLQPCTALGILPEEALFVDDQVKNCAAAEAVGMRSIVFQGAEKLREDLRAQGIPLLRAS